MIHWKGSGTRVTGTAQVTLRFAKQYLEPGEVELGKMPEKRHSFRVETEGGEKTRLQGGLVRVTWFFN